VKTPYEMQEEMEKAKINLYDCMKFALLSKNPQSTGFINIEDYRNFVQREEREMEKKLQEYEKKLDRLEKKLGKPWTQITNEEYHKNE
jgi:hypothetical protein